MSDVENSTFLIESIRTIGDSILNPTIGHFPDTFDPTSSVLFLGSGFSAQATNVMGENLPVGKGLEGKLAERLGIREGSEYDLKDLSTYASNRGENIYSFLNNIFTVNALTDDQCCILSKTWRRIYTTNYDDSVEWYNNHFRVNPKPTSYSIEDVLPKRILPRSIIHLHGFVHKCSKENVLNQLVLSHYSYAEQIVKYSPWWSQFERDLRSAEGVFFVGYNLNDFSVAAYLTKTPDFKKKCHFILKPETDPVLSDRIAEYGILHSIAVTGFTEKCRNASPRQTLAHPNALQGFRYFDLYKDNKAPIRPTPIEIEALMTLGNFKLPRLLSTFPDPSYVIARSSDLNVALDALRRARTLIIHSKIGNGKSIFRNCLLMRLSELGHTCFECRDDTTIPERDIDFLQREEKPVVVFSSFDMAYAILGQLTGLPKTTRFIVEINSSTLQVRRIEVYDQLIHPVKRLDLNRLKKRDVDDLHRLLDRAGIAPAHMRSRFGKNTEMRDIVLSLYDNQKVARRIDSLLKPMLENGNLRRILHCSVILKSVDLKIDPGFLRIVTGVDPYEALAMFDERVLEIMSFDLDRVEPHSSIFSKYLIQKYLDARELSDWVYHLCAEAARRKEEEYDLHSARSRDSRHLLGVLLRHRELVSFFHSSKDRDGIIGDLYERGRSNVHINSEPLFWLQYSIYMQDMSRFDIAEMHMQTAYERAANLTGFKTYQIDTYSFSLLLELEVQERRLGSTSVSRFEVIVDRLEVLRGMLSDGSHRLYVLNVLMKLEDFLLACSGVLSESESMRLTYHLHLLMQTLDEYNVDVKMETGSEKTKVSLGRSLKIILRT